MVTLTAGRNIADSEKERVKAELDAFNTRVGPEVLKVLTKFILERKSFAVRVQIHGTDGRIEKVQIQPDFTIALDAQHDT
jgi:hypothetical protein